MKRPTNPLRSAKVKGNVRKGAVMCDLLAAQLRAHLGEPAREHVFHPTRKWRMDLAFSGAMVCIEVDGGNFVAGAHGRGAQRRNDMEKDAEAMALGWRVLRVMPEHVRSGQAATWARRIAGCPA